MSRDAHGCPSLSGLPSCPAAQVGKKSEDQTLTGAEVHDNTELYIPGVLAELAEHVVELSSVAAGPGNQGHGIVGQMEWGIAKMLSAGSI